MPDDPAALAIDEPTLKIFRIVLTYSSCLTAVCVYDWLLNLKKEYKLIWRQKFTVVSFLYIGLRYFEIIRGSTTIYLANNLIPNDKCPPWGRWQVYGAMTMTTMAFTLFTLRASAIYGNSKIVMAFLSILGATILVIEGVASPEFSTIPWATGHGPCFAGKGPDTSKIVVIFWAGPFVFDVVTTFMLIARIVLIRRRGGSDSSIVRLLARDGLLYFTLISAANLINIGFYLGAREDLQSINSSMAYDVTSVMSSRLILSLRAHAWKSEQSGGISSHPGYVNNKSQAASGMTKVKAVPGLTNRGGDEKFGEFGPNGGMQAHIALSTFGATHRKQVDEESLEDGHVQAMPGVFVVSQTQTHVDVGSKV